MAPNYRFKLPPAPFKIRMVAQPGFPELVIDLYSTDPKVGYSFIPYVDGKRMGNGVYITRRELDDRLISGLYELV